MVWKFWQNTDTNIIRFKNIDRIRIQILFGLKKSTEYKYKYYSVWKYRPNTNTNIIRFEKITWIRILVFGLNYSNNIRIRNYSLTSVTIRIRHHHYHLYHCHHEIIGKLSNINIIFFVSNQSPYLPLISTHCIGMCTTLCSTLWPRCISEYWCWIDIHTWTWKDIAKSDRTCSPGIDPFLQVRRWTYHRIDRRRRRGKHTLVIVHWPFLPHSWKQRLLALGLIERQKWVGRYL